MRIIQLVFFLISYSVMLALIVSSAAEEESIDFPVFEIPETNFIDVSSGCGGFTDCIEYVGAVLHNVGEGLISLVLFIIEMFEFVIQLFGLMLTLAVEGIEGAPWYVNLLLNTPIVGSIALIIYKLLRSGRSAD